MLLVVGVALSLGTFQRAALLSSVYTQLISVENSRLFFLSSSPCLKTVHSLIFLCSQWFRNNSSEVLVQWDLLETTGTLKAARSDQAAFRSSGTGLRSLARQRQSRHQENDAEFGFSLRKK